MGVEKLPRKIPCHITYIISANNILKIMKLQSTGACFDNIVYSLSIVAFTFICASVFGRSWEHGSGVIPDYLKPGPKNLTSINPKILINKRSQDDNPAPPDPP